MYMDMACQLLQTLIQMLEELNHDLSFMYKKMTTLDTKTKNLFL